MIVILFTSDNVTQIVSSSYNPMLNIFSVHGFTILLFTLYTSVHIISSILSFSFCCALSPLTVYYPCFTLGTLVLIISSSSYHFLPHFLSCLTPPFNVSHASLYPLYMTSPSTFTTISALLMLVPKPYNHLLAHILFCDKFFNETWHVLWVNGGSNRKTIDLHG